MQTSDGKVAIEDLREGDMVIARDEDGGITGIYPVTAIMQRQTAAALYLTLENAAGETSQLGVTAEHPLFDVAAGWTQAGELAAGDQVADADMQPLTVLAIVVDDTPQLVHNLEVGGAHTYFAGDMAAWAHNARKFNPPNPPNPSQIRVNGVCYTSNFPNDHGPAHLHVSGGGPATRSTPFGGPVDGTDRPLSAKQRRGLCNPAVRGLMRNAAKWGKYYANR